MILLKNTKAQVLSTTVVRNGAVETVNLPGKGMVRVEGTTPLSEIHRKRGWLIVVSETPKVESVPASTTSITTPTSTDENAYDSGRSDSRSRRTSK